MVTKGVAFTLSLVGFTMVACGGSHQRGPDLIGRSERPDVDVPSFAFDSLDERLVNSASMRGHPAVLCFITTGNLASQVQVNYLTSLARSGAVKDTSFAIIAVEPRTNRELVELYRAKLGIPFPVAIVDEEALAQQPGFSDVNVVPTVFVLDADGHIHVRRAGILNAGELLSALNSAR